MKAIDEKCHVDGLQMDCLGREMQCHSNDLHCHVVEQLFPLYTDSVRDRKLQEMKEARGRTATSRVNWSKAIRGWNVSEFSVFKLQLSLKLLDCCCRGPENFFPVTSDASIQLFSLLIPIPATLLRVSASNNSIQMRSFFLLFKIWIPHNVGVHWNLFNVRWHEARDCLWHKKLSQWWENDCNLQEKLHYVVASIKKLYLMPATVGGSAASFK